MKIQNVFNKVIKSENQFSQLLLNLINQDPTVKSIAESFFFEDISIDINSLHCQKRHSNGQPDIFMSLNTGDYVIIEVKTQDSNLTENQPKGYVEILQKQDCKDKRLYFLIPKYYKHEEEIIKRFGSLVNTEGIEFKIFYWNELVRELRRELLNQSKQKSNLLAEVVEHLHEKFGFNNIDFTVEQFNTMKTDIIPSTIIKLNEVVDSLIKSFSYKDYKFDNEIESGYGEGYGFFYKNTFYIGYDFQLWNEKGVIFIIMANRNQIGEDLFEKFKSYFIKYGDVQLHNSDFLFIDITDTLKQQNNIETINEMVMQFFSFK